MGSPLAVSQAAICQPEHQIMPVHAQRYKAAGKLRNPQTTQLSGGANVLACVGF